MFNDNGISPKMEQDYNWYEFQMNSTNSSTFNIYFNLKHAANLQPKGRYNMNDALNLVRIKNA